MVGEELDGYDEDRPMPRARELGEELTEVRAEPVLGGVPGALICPAPAMGRQPGGGGDALARRAQLGDVCGLVVEDPTREAVRGEDDRDLVPVVA